MSRMSVKEGVLYELTISLSVIGPTTYRKQKNAKKKKKIHPALSFPDIADLLVYKLS